MVGANRYRRKWSTTVPQRRRSPVATLGKGLVALSCLVLVAVVLYVFGVVGSTARQRAGIVPTTVAHLVPPPAPLVVPSPVGAAQPFGTLPPVAPFTTQPPNLALTYELSGPLTGGAPTADVFRVTWAAPTVAQVDGLARKLGLTGPVRQPKAGTYTVDGNGKLTVDARATFYVPVGAMVSAAPFSDEKAAVSSARGWLASHDFLPPDAGPVDVQRGPDYTDITFHPRTLPEILSGSPGVRLRIGEDGGVREVNRAWPTLLTPGAYDLIPLDTAWQQAPQRGVTEIQLPSGVTVPPNTAARAVIDNVSVAYTLATASNGNDYLQPVYLFSGKATIPGQTAQADVRVAVPAVRDAQQPAG